MVEGTPISRSALRRPEAEGEWQAFPAFRAPDGADDPAPLFAQWAEALHRLREGPWVWSANAPLGDFAEWLVCQHYGGRLAPAGQKGFDIEVDRGDRIERLQVKALLQTGPPRRRISIRAAEPPPFDALVAVIFNLDPDLRCRAFRFPWEYVAADANSRPDERAGRLVFMLTKDREQAAEKLFRWP